MRTFIDSVGGDKLAVAGGIAAVAIYVIAFVTVCLVISA